LYVNKFLILQSVRNSTIKKIRMLNIVLFGPPGAGKGTQSEMLISQYNLVHLATGDIFRFNIKNGTDLGKLAKGYMNQGQLVPDEVTIKMLNAEVEKHPKAEGFIFDGFPRTNPQAMAKGTAISCMLALEVSEDELKARLLKRAEVSGRADDANIEVIENRIRVYNNETAPVKSYFEQQNKLSLIDGTGTIESITERLLKAIDAKF
jgi:adenylate kinase